MWKLDVLIKKLCICTFSFSISFFFISSFFFECEEALNEYIYVHNYVSIICI